MSSRSKRILSLALNKGLKEKIAAIRSEKRHKDLQNISTDTAIDPDYVPHGDSSDSSDLCDDDGDANQDEHVELTGNNTEDDDPSFITELLREISHNVMNISENDTSRNFTKKGKPRKRKRYEVPLSERKKQKQRKLVEEHKVRTPCTDTCHLKCTDNITFQRQKDINRQFWGLSNKNEKHNFAFGCIKRFPKKRSTVENSKRKNTFKYFLKSEDGSEINVCKLFLLATLGYDLKNNRILKTVRYTTDIRPKTSQRGRKPATKVDRDKIIVHIKSFNPVISHYRREHAPKRLYLPSDISITTMYNDFKSKYPEVLFSHELYRREVANLNISFAKLGNEECFECESFNLHCLQEEHSKDAGNRDCEMCVRWKNHKKKYTAAREEYKNDERRMTDGKFCVSADLQKVVMLPRADKFKDVIFFPRIICFNESILFQWENIITILRNLWLSFGMKV